MKVMRVGLKTSTSPPHSAELWESTTSPQWRVHLSIQWTLVNHQQLQSSMKSLHLADTDTAATHAITWYSPAPMMRVLWDPVNNTAHAPAPMPKVQPAGEQNFYLQCTTTCVITSHLPHNQFLIEAWVDDTSSKEHFPTAPLDDGVWAEEPILDRCLCIHETPDKPNHLCSYPCPYDSTIIRVDSLQSMPWNVAVLNYKQMDISDISADLPDIMTTMSDDDIPDLVDLSNSEHLDNIQQKTYHVQCIYYQTRCQLDILL